MSNSSKLFPFVLTKPQDELAPIAAQENISRRIIGTSFGDDSESHHRVLTFEPTTTFSLSTSRKTKARRGCCSFCFGLGSLATALCFVLLVVTLPQLLSTCLDAVERFQEIDQNFSHEKITSNNNNNDNSYHLRPQLSIGTAGETEIAYFQQRASNPTPDHHHVVLLHGAGVSNEAWKSSGVLAMFRKLYPSVTVTAVDLPVTADHYQLASLLESMEESGVVESLPVSALVTPSASGKSVTTWIQSDDEDYYHYDDDTDTGDNSLPETQKSSGIFSPLLWDLPEYFSAWIPVASHSVTDCSDEELERLKNLSRLRVLAIHGDKDANGRKISERLFDLIKASMTELPGEDPVYLKSPMAFVEAIGREILSDDR